jgi:hypothetical protein
MVPTTSRCREAERGRIIAKSRPVEISPPFRKVGTPCRLLASTIAATGTAKWPATCWHSDIYLGSEARAASKLKSR